MVKELVKLEKLLILAELNLIKKAGAWYSYNDEKIGQGRENAKAYLDNNIELKDKLEKQIRTHYGLK